MTKAMILAAGRGMRMRPLSDTTPKPLLKIGSDTLIERHILALKEVGITEIIINVHHLAEKIMAYLGDGERYDVQIHYSHEKEVLLGPAGGIRQALLLLGSEPFLLLSADIFTDYPISSLHTLANKHRDESDTWAGHLVMVDNPSFLPKGDFNLDSNGCLGEGTPKLTYASFGVLHPKLFDKQELGFATFSDIILPAIKQRQITGEHYHGLWHNIGTPEQLKAVRELNEKTLTS